MIPILCLFPMWHAFSQERETILEIQEEIQIESQLNGEDVEPEDDSFLLLRDEFRRHPLNLNYADADELRELRIVTDLQIQQLLQYRQLFGRLISIYELQAVPGWDIETISRIKPMITVRERVELSSGLLKRLYGGESNLMVRTSMIPQLSMGFKKKDSSGSTYLGSEHRLMARYLYNYKGLLQFGILGDKDAGEQFFKGAQKQGFDFYSWHFFARKIGKIESIAVGDYTISMGQGLIHWQANGMRKNADAMMIKRQGQVIRPYRSAGEYNFNRGLAIAMNFGRISLSVVGSIRKFTATQDADSSGDYVRSIITSGYHRTHLEIAKRQNLPVLSGGAVARYRFAGGSIALNTIQYQFDQPLKPQDKPYDLFAISGNYWSNYSLDFQYTKKNVHGYGEAAVDRNGNPAIIHGTLIGLHRMVDLSIVYRNISHRYQSFAGNSFTENSGTSNEKGIYSGLVIRPRQGWVINLYADFFESPWLRYRTDMPAPGSGYLAQLIHTPRRGTEIFARFSSETKWQNITGAPGILPVTDQVTRSEFRLQFSHQFTKAVLFRSRISASWFRREGDLVPQRGFLGFTDLVWKPMSSALSGNFRIQYFETDSYDTRIYAFENGPLYDMSIPASFGQGWRYYVNLRYKHGEPARLLKRRLDWTFWIKWSSSFRFDDSGFGSGNDFIEGSLRSEIRGQVVVAWSR